MNLNNLCGIDVGCTNIKMMAIINNEKFVKTIPSGDNFTRASLIEAIYNFYLSFNNVFSGLGIAFSGGTSDFQKVDFTTLQCLKGLSSADFSDLNNNVKLINDSNATTLAGTLEYPNSKVLVGITNGTGIGCGIAIDGKLFTGSNGYLGEIYGNPTIKPNSKISKLGKLCSGSKILKKINLTNSEEEHTRIINDASLYLGLLMADIIHLYNPDVIYLSGGAFSFNNFLDNSIEICKQNVYSHFLSNLIFVKTCFDEYSGCIGAMKLVSPKQ